MRLHRIAFVFALVCAGFAWALPTSWDRHLILALVAAVWFFTGIGLAATPRLEDPWFDSDEAKWARQLPQGRVGVEPPPTHKGAARIPAGPSLWERLRNFGRLGVDGWGKP